MKLSLTTCLLVATALSTMAMAGCAADSTDDGSTEPDVGNTGAEEAALVTGRAVPPAEIASLLRGAGFPEAEIGPMVCTAKWESSWRDHSTNKNHNGTTDYGLFQINSVHLGTHGCPSTTAALFDDVKNTECAYQIWKSQGRKAWYGYQHHRAQCASYPAP